MRGSRLWTARNLPRFTKEVMGRSVRRVRRQLRSSDVSRARRRARSEDSRTGQCDSHHRQAVYSKPSNCDYLPERDTLPAARGIGIQPLSSGIYTSPSPFGSHAALFMLDSPTGVRIKLAHHRRTVYPNSTSQESSRKSYTISVIRRYSTSRAAQPPPHRYSAPA
jgi:hypothetical protein